MATWLTGGVIGRWSVDDVVSFLRTGHGRGAVAFGAMAPVIEESTQYMTNDDLHAIAVYLKSLSAHGPAGTYNDNEYARARTYQAIATGEFERHGGGIYLSFCARCHEADGQGQQGKVAALAGNSLVLAPDPTSIIRIVTEGSKSPQTETGPEAKKMPAFTESARHARWPKW
ncbi:c-type cytochrome [Paraburkholderia kururiensis]|uniref:c-type cytochrome n=1 Tax=Paraburkholderia kururiensis TaxID=984307 RepID=UPI0039A661A2